MAERPSVLPRIRCVPPAVSSLGGEAVELVAGAGQVMDPWQVAVLEDAMGLQESGLWSAFRVGVNVPRQNGKGAVAEARVLWEMLTPKRLVVWSSQQQDTSTEALHKIVALIEASTDLTRLLKKVTYANGKEGIWFRNGSRIRFMTRSKSRARGFSGDLIVFDEAMFLAEYSVGAMLPLLASRENPQVWFMGSAVDQQIHDEGVVWARVREQGIAGADGLAYTEFSVEADNPSALTRDELYDEGLWAEANPALDIRISREYVRSELDTLDTRSAAVERFGVGDWPRTDHTSSSPLQIEAWLALTDPTSVLQDPVWFGYDVSPNRSGAIMAAGLNQRGELHVETVERRPGTGWIVPRLVELSAKHEVEGLIRDGYGPVTSLAGQEQEAGLVVETTSAAEHGDACGKLLDLVEERSLRHTGQNDLADAVRGSATRPLGDAWAWSRKNSSVDISPLVAATLALSAAVEGSIGMPVIY